VAVVLALASAAVFALGTVLQQREAMGQSEDQAASAGILLRLARRPVWLAGVGAYAAGYGLQAVALGIGRLVVVQPILATTIVFALPLGARLSAQRITRRDVAAALVVTVGLGLFLLLSDPGGGRKEAPVGEWVVAGGAVIGAAAALTVAGLSRSGAIRAALLGTAAGLLFGLVSALTKETVEVLDQEGLGMFGEWQVYALGAVGFCGMTLTQMALQTGILPPAVATSSIFNPALSVLLGLTLFEESIHRDALDSALAVVALVAMFGGVAALALGQRPEAPQEADRVAP
jgi:drug/metabolite transporter (DMT)-like permease